MYPSRSPSSVRRLIPHPPPPEGHLVRRQSSQLPTSQAGNAVVLLDLLAVAPCPAWLGAPAAGRGLRRVVPSGRRSELQRRDTRRTRARSTARPCVGAAPPGRSNGRRSFPRTSYPDLGHSPPYPNGDGPRKVSGGATQGHLPCSEGPQG